MANRWLIRLVLDPFEQLSSVNLTHIVRVYNFSKQKLAEFFAFEKKRSLGQCRSKGRYVFAVANGHTVLGIVRVGIHGSDNDEYVLVLGTYGFWRERQRARLLEDYDRVGAGGVILVVQASAVVVKAFDLSATLESASRRQSKLRSGTKYCIICLCGRPLELLAFTEMFSSRMVPRSVLRSDVRIMNRYA
ncbi:hypothetical protein BpHYR1_046376 [Brachionus plicatilis]|uniref:Uncharacterized protein n=1 Tax=Brachionus plicatilis TaxID=10195 RepID=A0A3M7PPA4_BRAPC|nr:hypothetical protein BpHYR1_046376 [Brachionus plicatilis]